jgi:argininosuccinate lyase
MPQKRNPDVAEIIRGKTGRVYGDLIALLTIMKGIPLAYNRDMQEDKPPVFDAVDTAKGCLETAAAMVSSMTIHPERMNQATGKGFLQATEVADYLTRKGLPFRQAHGIVHDMVDYCIKQQKTLQDLTRNELKRFSPCFTDDIASLLIPCKIVERKSSYGGTSSASVRRQIQKLKKVLSA